MGLALVRTYPDAASAQIDRGILEAAGIPAAVEDEQVPAIEGMMSAAIGHVRLSVEESKAEEAARLLEHDDARGGADPEFDADERACPKCGSTDIERFSPYAFLVIIPIFFPLIVIRRTWCARCRHRWKE